MTLFERIKIVVAITSSLLLTGCNNSNTPSNSSEEHSEVKIESDSNLLLVESQEDSIIDSISCLDVSFIENLETGWLSGYKDPRLTKNGFVYESIRNIDNGKERFFKNYTLGTTLKISKIEYPDGETFFTVKYQITQEQLKCFEESLSKSSNFKLDKGKYTKKGLGTYAEKHFSINSESLWITYKHRVGKELSLPQINQNFDSIKLIDATNNG